MQIAKDTSLSIPSLTELESRGARRVAKFLKRRHGVWRSQWPTSTYTLLVSSSFSPRRCYTTSVGQARSNRNRSHRARPIEIKSCAPTSLRSSSSLQQKQTLSSAACIRPVALTSHSTQLCVLKNVGELVLKLCSRTSCPSGLALSFCCSSSSTFFVLSRRLHRGSESYALLTVTIESSLKIPRHLIRA